MTAAARQDGDVVEFWYTVLGPKFIRFRHILVEGTSNHSAQFLPRLGLNDGDPSSTSAAASGIRRSNGPGW